MPPAERGLRVQNLTLHEVVQARGASLVQNATFAIFKEEGGSADYSRWRKDVMALVARAVQDFLLALEYA